MSQQRLNWTHDQTKIEIWKKSSVEEVKGRNLTSIWLKVKTDVTHRNDGHDDDKLPLNLISATNVSSEKY